MGIRSYLRGDDILAESRTLSPPVDGYRQTWLSVPTGYSDFDQLPNLTSSPLGRVTEQNVLKVADAYACVRVLADSISTLPLKVYRRLDAGRVPAGPDSRAVQLLSRPAPGSTGVDLVSQIVTHLNVHGNAYLGKYRGADGEIVQLGLISPERIGVELDGQRVLYVLDGKTEHGPADILHLKGLSLDGVVGISPIAHCRVALGLNEDLRESSRQYFRKGSRPSGILTVPPEQQMNPEFVETVKKAWELEHAGAENMHKIVIVGGGAQFTPVAFSADDNQFLQQRELSTREVARVFRVPSWAIDGSSGDSLTYANVQEQARALVIYSLRPWIVRIERALSNDSDLCPGSTFCEFDLDGLLRADAATRSEVYTRALDAETGWMTRAEVRELENLNPEGGPNA